jgi:hypothetical protein
MATREQRASARGTIAGREPDRDETTAEAAVASAASVPWAPAGIVYAHQDEPGADEAIGLEPGEPGDTDDFNDDVPSRPSLLRRAIPLLWAAALTVAALQHAGEVERRAALREPSPAELEMQDRAQGEIKAAWRSLGAVAAATEVKAAEPVVEEKIEAAVVQTQSEPAVAKDARSEPQNTQHALLEPLTEVIRTAANSQEAESSTAGTAQEAVPDKREATPGNKNTAAAATNASEEQPQAEGAARAVTFAVTADEPAQTARKGRVTTSHASRPHVARAAPARSKRTRVSSSTYVAFDGHGPRYFTIERPSRLAP